MTVKHSKQHVLLVSSSDVSLFSVSGSEWDSFSRSFLPQSGPLKFAVT